jgi:hypothetical protein
MFVACLEYLRLRGLHCFREGFFSSSIAAQPAHGTSRTGMTNFST